MNKLKIGLCFVVGVFGTLQNCLAQGYPKGYFQSPMDTPLMLSAPFGSLRDNHFHSGMDIRTNEQIGLPVYAIADGYVARIKYSSVGYGKAIYINHPNGFTSVYGHLQNAEGELALYIKQYQYEQEKFEFDHFPAVGKLKAQKGQIIGWSGNSGASTGPHLHFEIRDTRTEQIINPQLFGIKGFDQYSPTIKKVVLYSLKGNAPITYSEYSITSNKLLLQDSIWLYTDTIRVPIGLWGLGLEAVDFLHNPDKEYSIYRMAFFADGKKYFEHKMDRFAFDQSKNINVHIDYARYKQEKVRYQKCFKDDGNRIGIYNYLRNRGKLPLYDTLIHDVLLEVGDFEGFTHRVKLLMQADETLSVPQEVMIPNRVATLFPAQSFTYRTKEFEVAIPAGSLYDTIQFGLSVLDRKPRTYSNAIQVHYPTTPLVSSISVSIKPDGYNETQTTKFLIASVNASGNFSSVGGGFENGRVTAKVSNFGTFVVVADSVPPIVKILNSNNKGQVQDSIGLRVQIKDELSGIASYRATLNGKWILMEYDAKNDELLYSFDEKTLPNQKQDFVLTVIDKKGNATELVAQLEFKK